MNIIENELVTVSLMDPSPPLILNPPKGVSSLA